MLTSLGYGIDYRCPQRLQRFLLPNSSSSPSLVWNCRNVLNWCSCGHFRCCSGLQRSHRCPLRLGFRLGLLKAVLFETLELATPLGSAAPTAARSVVLCEVSTMSFSFQSIQGCIAALVTLGVFTDFRSNTVGLRSQLQRLETASARSWTTDKSTYNNHHI